MSAMSDTLENRDYNGNVVKITAVEKNYCLTCETEILKGQKFCSKYCYQEEENNWAYDRSIGN